MRQYIYHEQLPIGGIFLAADEISLTGYAGGIDKKVKLLELEKVDMQSFFISKKGTAL